MNTLYPSVPAGRRHLPVTVVVLAVMVLGLALCAPVAFAETRVPKFVKNSFGHDAFSTRVQIEGYLENGGLSTEWQAEYGTSCNGPWTEVNKGESEELGGVPLLESSARIGERDPFSISTPPSTGPSDLAPFYLRHLTPNASYCARFTAKNADGEATPEVVPFKTLPVAKPEVDREEAGEYVNHGHLQYTCVISSDTTVGCGAEIDGNGAETTYSFEYAVAEPGGGRPAETSGSWKTFTSGATGAITVGQSVADTEAKLAGLVPETTYYVRLKMRNSAGEVVQRTYNQTQFNGNPDKEPESFDTTSARPVVSSVSFRNVTPTSAVTTDGIEVAGSETHWRFEYAQAALGPWSVVPGGDGVIPQTLAAATPYYDQVQVAARLSGLSSASTYYVRLFAENAAGEGEFCYGDGEEREQRSHCEQLSIADHFSNGFPGSFETGGTPSLTTFAVHDLSGDQLQLDGGVNPKSVATASEQEIEIEGSPTGGTFTLTFNGQTTGPIAYNAPAGEGSGSGSVEAALRRELDLEASVEGAAGGPYTVVFSKSESEPPIECHSALTPSGTCTVTTILKGGESAETHYRFQYASQASFAEHGWAGAAETSEEAVAPGSRLQVVHALLPVLQAGETYHYRLLATSSIPGVGLLEAGEQTLVDPAFTVHPNPSPCPNEALRTGLSSHLPDCRAYELLTPIDKGGSQEPFTYGVEIGSGVHVGEDGDHAVLEATGVSWGSGPGAGGSPYFFSREAGKGWTMTAGSPQPATGVSRLVPQLYNADASQFAFESAWVTGRAQSERSEYEVGPAGGPYTTVASMSHKEPGAWVASNASLSKLILTTLDHSLQGEPTGTTSGYDLYEYTAQGGLRQLNVNSEGATIGSCGATVVDGREVGPGGFASSPTGSEVSTANTVSADGSRVFFYASAPHECVSNRTFVNSSPSLPSGGNLYVRVNGSETFDIGAYTFIGANEQGTVLLLENGSGELFRYDSETGKLEPQSAGEKATAAELAALGIPDQAEPEPSGSDAFYHPRYTYWSPSTKNVRETGISNGQGESVLDGQVYRYDDVEHVVECVSCASSYDANPKQPAFLNSGRSGSAPLSPFPLLRSTSGNGEFAFFVTASALVPQDVDGEIPIEGNGEEPNGDGDVHGTTSLSTDVYEWRAAGVDGCDAVQGCLALITDGHGGLLNTLLGVAEEGREAFIYTNSKLLPQDLDTAGDIYAVRVDGGFAPPPTRPTECEGDACSTPPPAPNDATPSSLTFSGSGNVAPAPSTKAAVKAKQPKKKTKKRTPKKKSKKKGKAGSKGRVRKSTRGVRS